MMRCFASFFAAALIAPALCGEEPSAPIAVEPSGIVPVEDERRVLLDGVNGDLVVQVGKPGELRFMSTKMGKKDPLPIALYAEPEGLVFRPPAGAPVTARTFQMSVPPGVLVRVEAQEGGKLTVSGLRGGLEVVGRNLSVDARGLTGNVELNLQGGTVLASSVQGAVRLRGAGTNGTFDGVQNGVTLAMQGGAAMVRGVGSLDADVVEVVLKVERVSGSARIVADGASVEVSGLSQGGDLKLTGAPLKLAASRGDINVSSDANVEYKATEASLHFDMYGGSVSGDGNKGIVEVRTRNASVGIAKNAGNVRVEGDGLKLKISDIDGEAFVVATFSDVTLTNIAGAINVECDGGELVVNQARQAIQARVNGGDVRMTQLQGPVDLSADGNSVDVSWTALSDKDSKIVNDGGDVTARFPSSGTGCRVEARSTSGGRVETDLPRVRILQDGSQAQGWVGNAQRPTVYVEASGDVHLLGGGGAAPAAAPQ